MRRTKLSIAILAASMLLLTASIGAASAGSPRLVAQVIQLRGDNEVIGVGTPTCAPPTVCGDPDGRGLAGVVIIPALDLVCWALTWRNLAPVTLAHIHGPATTQTAAPVLVDFTASLKVGANSASGCTHDTDADAIAANPSAYYVNVHTATEFPAGAIRGQLR
jgi:hypothetical protein